MLTATIPSYLYQEYADDSDLQAFVAAYNGMAQAYVTWFATAALPVYSAQFGALLDWTVNGLYGIPRPTLDHALVSDDVYKRCVTWQMFRGDGNIFNIRWLKRRLMRFLEGAAGIDPGINQTYQISVRFGSPNIVYINILGGIAQITGGSIFNQSGFDTDGYNELDLNIQHYADTTLAPILKEAIDAGVLELPFQYQYVVNVNP